MNNCTKCGCALHPQQNTRAIWNGTKYLVICMKCFDEITLPNRQCNKCETELKPEEVTPDTRCKICGSYAYLTPAGIDAERLALKELSEKEGTK